MTEEDFSNKNYGIQDGISKSLHFVVESLHSFQLLFNKIFNEVNF